MNKRRVGKSDLYVSEIGLGTMSLGTNEQQGKEIIDRALDSGINYLDTADLYDFGQNEEIVGKAIKGRREDVILGTKVGNHWEPGKEGWYWDPSKSYIKSQVKESLRRLQTDYIDLYQLHGGTIEDPIDETIEAFEELVQEGVIRYYGISSIRPNVIREFVEKSNIVSVMMQYSLFDRRPEEEVLDLLHDNHISVFARGPVAKGMLSNKGEQKVEEKAQNGYLTYSYEEMKEMVQNLQTFATDDRSLQAISLQYVLRHPALASAIFGASSVEQVDSNVAMLDALDLTDNLYTQLQQITRPIVYQKHR
ncbi:oxidoreductase [Pontibacillus halophilus JSM 076056 = DSM 19796]|uniref:Oxidoreductase n=1 Tax=Pontibacillus halophilus JSM 076056 = DSM 19796 TaxID=1385510 RepID=A0A0A5GG65_9BACI|nr:aldo/keto reductase [Pontibacillus halophilus]KGX92241.1 oxidoreductase [Pontibacillus halophilus JSM 076056 = DSM 19796]